MKVSNVPFKGTEEQKQKLLEVIKEHKDQRGSLMPIMQAAQDIYGYLPYQVQKIISDETGIPIEKVYGVATFYAQFTMSPKGKYQVSVCLGTACYVKGSGNVLDKVEQVLGIKDGECTPDGVFSIETCRCVGACGLAPVMIVGGDVYGKIVPDDVPGILAKYK
jgi:NADP-reducing hydrogenase subunit HndA